MHRNSFLFILLFILLCTISCEKTAKEQGQDNYKNRFLKLVEFECKQDYADYYVKATFDNINYCLYENDSIKPVARLFNNFTTSGPSTKDTIIGSAYNTLWFGIFREYDLDTRIKHLLFISPKYPPTSTIGEIAADLFVEGRKWPISGKNITQNAVTCQYRFSDSRKGFNTFYYVSSDGGIQSNSYLIIEKVKRERKNNHISYEVELSFEANLYLNELDEINDNLWAELRNGRMRAKFIIPF